ncbi:hypothetical protein PF008_g28892 [Phytophthora fragariae]|uniref:RXLR phytopathogen effector protein WY-domain domain-containing protein n=1 Tax=Phytophthora fragariae TaxID=53985 RepID=A0A6G0QA31_9STRA|nr:hypothetical protein PF008_g28892 [Phytophthora fragariae]
MTTGSVVNAYYDDLSVVKMILAGDKIPSSADAAKRMEGVLFKEWMAAPDHAFEELKIGQVGLKKLFKDPMINYWMSFMDVFTKSFPLKNVPRTMLATTYKDDDLWRMIQAAKKNPKTKKMGDKLETEILKQFVFAEKKPSEMAKLLQVSEKTDAN